MTDSDSDDDRAHRITRLVDGTVDDADRAGAEAWMRERPEIASEVAAEQRVVAELRASGPEAPERLVASVRDRVAAAYGPPPARDRASAEHVRPSAERDRPSGGRDRPWAGPHRFRWTRSGFVGRPALVASGLGILAAAVAIVLVIAGGSGGGPSIVRAAQLAYAPSTRPAPAASSARFLDVSYGGVRFPNYQSAFGAVPIGERTDRIGGRPALTVFYRLRDGKRLSYTVFSGPAVARPSVAVATVYQGVRLHVFFTSSKLAVVTLVRFGRTCVLAAPTTRDAVLALAAEPIRTEAV